MATLFRVTWTWAIASGFERAAHTLHILGSTGETLTQCAAAVNANNTLFIQSLGLNLPTQTTLIRTRIDQVNEVTGRVIAGVDGSVPAIASYAGSNPLPPQCAVVTTLRTALSGPRFRGRMYLPGVDKAKITGNGVLLTAARDGWRATAVTFLQGIINDPTTDLKPVVFSKTAGGSSPVVAVEVGDVLDTQRGRRDRMPESRTSGALVP